MRTFAQLEKWAESHGYIVERIGRRRIEWYHKDKHSIIGDCSTVRETHDEICAEILIEEYRIKRNLTKVGSGV